MSTGPRTPDEVARHAARVAQVRARREGSLREPMGWLSLVGLHWLEPGSQRFGGAASTEIVLRAAEGELPAVAGSLSVAGGLVRVHPAPGSPLTINGEPVPDGRELADDEAEEPTILQLASLRMYLIRRGDDRLALRVKDVAAPALRAFAGMPCYPVDPAWRITAGLVPADPGATIPVPDIVGDLSQESTPGDVVFEHDGVTHRLHALEAQPGHLFLVFGDVTNGRETYAGGRFLVSGPVQPDDSVELDFNLAYNPPCVFTPYATCPLPPEGNRLRIAIPAGERDFHQRP